LESLIFAKDPIAASKLGHARGVALLVCARAQLSAYEYAPTLIKRAVTGTGRAEKHQVGQMIRILLKLESLPRADASDALAIALTHLQQVPVQLTQGRLSPASAGLMALLSTSAASGVRRGHKRRGSTV
jgi:crossover junction endodeoxyribonuclease RuvC